MERDIETAVAVALWRQGGSEEEKLSFSELYSLAETAGVQVVEGFTQNRAMWICYFVGPGKAQEIGQYVAENGIETVIFDGELSPSRSTILSASSQDHRPQRTDLDIFAQRATSRAGRLQVELAQLNAQLPSSWARSGSFPPGGGIGTGIGKQAGSGPATDSPAGAGAGRQIRAGKTPDPAPQTARAPGVFQVALVGYTNSSKSTLLNQLTQADSFAADASLPP